MIAGDGCDFKPKDVLSEIDVRGERQVRRIGEDFPLVFRMGMKDIDALAEKFVRVAGQQVVQRSQSILVLLT